MEPVEAVVFSSYCSCGLRVNRRSDVKAFEQLLAHATSIPLSALILEPGLDDRYLVIVE